MARTRGLGAFPGESHFGGETQRDSIQTGSAKGARPPKKKRQVSAWGESNRVAARESLVFLKHCVGCVTGGQWDLRVEVPPLLSKAQRILRIAFMRIIPGGHSNCFVIWSDLRVRCGKSAESVARKQSFDWRPLSREKLETRSRAAKRLALVQLMASAVKLAVSR